MVAGLINNLLRYCISFMKISAQFSVIVNMSLICSTNGLFEELRNSQNKYLVFTRLQNNLYVKWVVKPHSLTNHPILQTTCTQDQE